MRLALFAVAAAACLALPPAAPAAPTWLTPVTLAPAPASAPAVAAGPAGDAAAVWTRDGQVEGRVRAPGAPFGDVQALGSGAVPDVAISDEGTAFAAWAQGGAVLVAVRPPGGAFGAAQPLGGDGGSGGVGEVRLVANARGDALVAYARGGAFAALRPAGGGFEAPVRLSTGEPCDLGAAIGAAGHAAVAWHDGSCAGAGAARVARRAPGGGFPASAESLDAASAVAPAVAGDGTTGVALERAGTVAVAVAPAGGTFAAPARVSADAEAADAPALAAGPAGELQAAWRSTAAGRGARVATALRPPGSGFSGPAAVSDEGAGAPQVGVGGDGSAVVTWLRDRGSDTTLEAARRAAGATGFGPSVPVSAAGGDVSSPDLAVDGDGNALAGYARGGAVVHTLDAAGPRFDGLQIRSAGFAREPYEFSVSPADAWSAVAGTSFDFGDGTTVAATTAVHAYDTPGPKTITVSASDSVGNVSRASRPFDAAPALDRTAPVISRLRLTPARFRVAGRPTAVAARRAPRGTRFRYTLSEPAQVTIFFERVVMGRKRGKSCRRTRSRRGRPCRIYAPVGLITRQHPVAGAVSVRFSGRIVASNGPIRVIDTRFARGRYRATAAAADASRNVSKPVSTAFSVVR
ncbi:MAG TPA: PKD domain-containing protein [Solirubrobacteraceae bacterium]|nr:PKD domain-containing protein [Solirubrobacteraceae bacterium]